MGRKSAPPEVFVGEFGLIFPYLCRMKRLLLIGIAVLLAMASCQSPTRKARQMVKRAERLADTLPDSAAHLIDSVLRMPAHFTERERMEMALLQAEALFGNRDVSGSVSTLMDDDYFDTHANLSTSPELERAAAYYARKKHYGKAGHAALYSGFVQQHYNEKEAAMQSFKDAVQYGSLDGDSLTVALADYCIGKMLYEENSFQESLIQLINSEKYFGNHIIEKALVENKIAVCYIVLEENENAEQHLQHSLMLSNNNHLVRTKRKALNNYAVLYQLQGKHDQAIACLRKMAEESDLDEKEELLLYINLGDVFLEANEKDSAAYYYNLVAELLPKAQVNPESKVSAYISLSQFAETQDKDSLALYYWKQYDRWLNEVRDKTELNTVYGIQKKYDYGALQNLMHQKIIHRQWIIIILSVVAIFVLLVYAITQIRLTRIKKQESEIKDSLLRFMQKYEEYKNAYEDSDKKLTKALLKEHQIMQKMAVCLGNEKDPASFESLKYSVFGGQNYWEAMLKAFDRQFPGMRKELAVQHPELTETEEKILLLSYVDASRYDTSQLLGISMFMVDKLRTSVKKKMSSKSPENTKNG